MMKLVKSLAKETPQINEFLLQMKVFNTVKLL